MAKTKRKHGTKRLKLHTHLRKKPITRKRAKGREHQYPFLIKTMLNKTHLDTYGQEFHDTELTKKILSHLPIRDVKYFLTDKGQYEERLKKALVLNTQLLQDQTEAIKRIEQSGRDGPARRTRSRDPKKKDTIDPELLTLKIERDHTIRAISSNQYELQRHREDRAPGPNYIRRYIPYGFNTYADALKFENRPYYDKERMYDARRETNRHLYYV